MNTSVYVDRLYNVSLINILYYNVITVQQYPGHYSTTVPFCTYAAMWNCVKEGDLDQMSHITEWFPYNLFTVE